MLAKDSRLESRVPDITRFFDQQDSLSKQHDGITQIRKSRAVSSVGTAIALVVIGTLASLYGIADVFGGLKLPLGVWLLLGGPIMIPIGIYVGYSSLHRIATASQFSYETALGELCALFYWNVFCKKTSDLESKDDQIVDVCQFIPLPVLQHYRRSGWGTLAAKPRPRSGGYTVHCVRCHKKSDHVESYYTSIPVPTKFREEFRHEEPAETQALIKNLYLRCLECGTDICYECACYSTPKELRSLCPVCGKATSGFEGLASRWMNLRTSRTDQDIDFSLSSVVIDMMPRSDQRIVDVTIHLSGTPFGTLSLSNVAFNVEGNWFLATPEPFVR